MNWRLIIFAAIGAAVGINLLILLLVLALFYSGAVGLEEYFLIFALLSPLVASLISSGVVTHYAKSKKLLHTIVSTLITFALATAILFYATSPLSLKIYAAFTPPTEGTSGE